MALRAGTAIGASRAGICGHVPRPRALWRKERTATGTLSYRCPSESARNNQCQGPDYELGLCVHCWLTSVVGYSRFVRIWLESLCRRTGSAPPGNAFQDRHKHPNSPKSPSTNVFEKNLLCSIMSASWMLTIKLNMTVWPVPSEFGLAHRWRCFRRLACRASSGLSKPSISHRLAMNYRMVRAIQQPPLPAPNRAVSPVPSYLADLAGPHRSTPFGVVRQRLTAVTSHRAGRGWLRREFPGTSHPCDMRCDSAIEQRLASRPSINLYLPPPATRDPSSADADGRASGRIH